MTENDSQQSIAIRDQNPTSGTVTLILALASASPLRMQPD